MKLLLWKEKKWGYFCERKSKVISMKSWRGSCIMYNVLCRISLSSQPNVKKLYNCLMHFMPRMSVMSYVHLCFGRPLPLLSGTRPSITVLCPKFVTFSITSVKVQRFHVLPFCRYDNEMVLWLNFLVSTAHGNECNLLQYFYKCSKTRGFLW